MKKRLIVGMVFVSIILLLTALPLADVRAATASRPQGTLTAAVPTLAEEGYLPDRCSSTASPLWECVYDFLIYSDSRTLKPIPGVIERWEYSKDYQTLTLHVRKGIQFHDGWGELTAEDVKWNFEFNTRPSSTNLRSVDLKKIKSMDLPDRYTLVLHLKEPDPTLWLSLCTADNASLPVLCKKYVEKVGEEKANRQPVGSGPYRFVEHKMGDYAKFEAVENHWLVVPEFKTVIVRVVPEESTRIAMLKTGEIDIAMELSIENFADLERGGLRTVVSKNSNTIFIPFGGMMLPEDKRYVEGYHRVDPWKDARVREAMNIAIDRERIIKTLFSGAATPAPTWVPLPGWEKLEPIPYNPTRAKQLLAQAGYPNGFSLKFLTHSKDASLTTLAGAVAGYWEAVGVKADLVPGDYAAWRDTNKAGKTAGYVWTHVLPTHPDWSQRLSSYELPGASTPLWQSEETKVAIKKVQAELDPQKREANFQELARVYRSLYAHVPMVYAPRLHGASKKVGDWSPKQGILSEELCICPASRSIEYVSIVYAIGGDGIEGEAGLFESEYSN